VVGCTKNKKIKQVTGSQHDGLVGVLKNIKNIKNIMVGGAKTRKSKKIKPCRDDNGRGNGSMNSRWCTEETQDTSSTAV
jgi:hypothetical protein